MLLNTKANNRYGLSDVTQKQHALQCALLAEEANETPEMIAAALLHDIGHMLHDLGEGFADKKIDDDHENIGMAYLKDRVSSKVYQPIALHVQAKRYLCAAEPEYFQKLSFEYTRNHLKVLENVKHFNTDNDNFYRHHRCEDLNDGYHSCG